MLLSDGRNILLYHSDIFYLNAVRLISAGQGSLSWLNLADISDMKVECFIYLLQPIDYTKSN